MWNLLLASALSVGAVEVDVKTLQGTGASGTLLELSSERVLVATLDGKTTFKVAELLSVTPKQRPAEPEDKPPLHIELTGGSALAATSYLVGQGKARIGLASGGPVKLAAELVRSVRLNDLDEPIAERWQQILAAKATGDVIVVRRQQGDGVRDLEGVLGDVTSDRVQFDLDGDSFSVLRNRVMGFIYYHPQGAGLPEAICRVSDAAGSEWFARWLRLDQERLHMVSVTGTKASLPVAELKGLDFSAGKIVFLSDLEPQSFKWTPFLGSAKVSPRLAGYYCPRRDQSLSGGPLRLRGSSDDSEPRVFDKGLAIHSRTEMVYRPGRKFRRFQAVAGIDESVRRQGGHLRLEITADNKTIFDKIITGRDEPITLDLDIAGVRRLKILVDFGDELDIADHLDLCDARFIK